jgi:hypothetical protein
MPNENPPPIEDKDPANRNELSKAIANIRRDLEVSRREREQSPCKVAEMPK